MPNLNLYKAPQQVDQYVAQYPELKAIADNPSAVWLGGWSGDVGQAVSKLVANAAGKTLLLVSYNIPGRDNGNYSSGGLASPEAYYAWIGAIGAAIGNAPAIIILEPDAMGLGMALQEPAKGARFGMLSTACDILKKQPNVQLLIDLSMWVTPDDTYQSLQWSGINKKVDGFSCNVSGYKSLQEVQAWADQVGQKTGLYYAVDTSRNGVGTATDWCNPAGQGLGITPNLYAPAVGYRKYALWIKAPGESDGTCNGGPSAGTFWVQRAQELVKNAATSPVTVQVPVQPQTPVTPVTPVTTPPATPQQPTMADLLAAIQKLSSTSSVPAAPAQNSLLISKIQSIVNQNGDEHKEIQQIQALLNTVTS